MGLSMLAAAVLWSLGRSRSERLLWMLGATAAVAMITPIVRAAPSLSLLPDPIEWYIRPIPGRGTFTLFPWAGFLLAGAAIGLWLDAVRTPAEERRMSTSPSQSSALLSWPAVMPASFLPTVYREVIFLDDIPDVLLPAPRDSRRCVAAGCVTRGTPSGPSRSVMQEFWSRVPV